MFGLFKKKQHGGGGEIERVATHLKVMGYDLTPFGAGVAVANLMSGYNHVETASYIALITMALDIRELRESGSDIVKLASYYTHAMALLEVLKDYKDNGTMREELWKNYSNALFHASYVDENQEKWVAMILSDPVAGKQRLATSRIN